MSALIVLLCSVCYLLLAVEAKVTNFDTRILQSLSFGNSFAGRSSVMGRSGEGGEETLPELKGANLGQACSHTFHKEFIAPLYKTESRSDFISALKALRKQVDEKPEIESQSCLIFQKTAQSFNKCFENGTCGCNDEGPLATVLNTATGQCEPKMSSYGDDCSPQRAKEFYDQVFGPFHTKFSSATEPYEYQLAMDDYLKDLSKFITVNFTPGDDRRICFMQSPTHNLECKAETSKCGCLSASPFFEYKRRTEGDDGEQCEAKEGSVCELVSSTATGGGRKLNPIPLRKAPCTRLASSVLHCMTKAKLTHPDAFKTCEAAILSLFMNYRILIAFYFLKHIFGSK